MFTQHPPAHLVSANRRLNISEKSCAITNQHHVAVYVTLSRKLWPYDHLPYVLLTFHIKDLTTSYICAQKISWVCSYPLAEVIGRYYKDEVEVCFVKQTFPPLPTSDLLTTQSAQRVVQTLSPLLFAIETQMCSRCPSIKLIHQKVSLKTTCSPKWEYAAFHVCTPRKHDTFYLYVSRGILFCQTYWRCYVEILWLFTYAHHDQKA